MKVLATIALSLVAIVASLVLLLSTVCAISGGGAGGNGALGAAIICGHVALLVDIVSISAIGKLNRKE